MVASLSRFIIATNNSNSLFAIKTEINVFMMAHKPIGKFLKQSHIKFFKEKAKFNQCVSVLNVFQCIIMRYFVTLSNLF